MKNKMNFLVMFFALLFATSALAQTENITGNVIDENGNAAIAATVKVTGTEIGTVTDIDGNFNLEVPTNAETLTISYIGKDPKVVPITNNMTISLEQSDNVLDGVVVTALGIERDQRSLGYSTQQVSGEELTETQDPSPISALSGKVAGAQITTPSGNLGGSSRIILRGTGSITQNNRPLFVIDGVPLDNSNFNSTGTQQGSGGVDFGDTSFDINPADIASISVLKGGAAAALYGNRANNGVILITTKKGKAGTSEITINTGISFEAINIFPELQKEYGGGAAGSDFADVVIDGQTYQVVDYGTDESWGPRYDPNVNVLHWDAFDPEFTEDYLNPRPWIYPNTDRFDFFDTAITYNNGASFSSGTETSQVRLSLNNNKINGIVPNSELDKTTVNFNASTKIAEKLTFDAGINHTLLEGFNRPIVGYSGSLPQQFFQFGQTQLDFDRLKKYQLASGVQRTWNRVAFDDATPRFTDNPYWQINENTPEDRRTRFYGNAGLKYDFLDNFFLAGKVYLDTYADIRSEQTAIGSAGQSSYSEIERNFSEINYEGRLHYDKRFGEDFGISAFAGVNRRENRYGSINGATSGGLVVPDIYNINNSTGIATVGDYDERKRVESLFGSVSVDYKDTYYLSGTARNDWSSTLSPEDNSFFYPSVTGSVVFSEFLDNTEWINYGKIRGGYAEVGSDTNPYNLRNVFGSSNPFLGTIRYSQPSSNRNSNLRPELKKTWEVGLEMSLFEDRLSYDLTYYDEKTQDLITPVAIDPSTGFTSTVANAGELSNKGFEALVTITPVRNKDFRWDATWNYAKNNNELISLIDGTSTLRIGSYTFRGVTLDAVVGEPYGIIRGTDYVYDDSGNRVVNSDGLYEKTSTVQNLGSVLPDFRMGLRNQLKYKNLNFSFLIDRQKGGKYRSLTNIWGHYSGILQETVENNIREDGVLLEGVTGNVTFNDDGTYTVTNTAPNTQVISANEWGQDYFTGVDSRNVFDASYYKLREVNLGYTFPKIFSDKINSLQISTYGRNLIVWGLDNDNFDPEGASNGSGNIQGAEGGSLPSTRGYGLNLSIKF